MDVHLRCPNCGRVVGEANHENNYKEHFYHKNKKGQPICLTCGTGDNKVKNIVVGIFIITLMIISIAAIYVA